MKTLVIPPTEEPISLEEAKLHLRNPVDLDNPLITLFITAARRACETWMRRTFITSTWDYRLDRFRGCLEAISLPGPPLQSVESIKYVGLDGSLETLDPAKYVVEDGTDSRVSLAYGQAWPRARRQAGAVTIRYVAGYGGASDVPASIKAAILLYVTALYENRGEANIPLPEAARYLLAAEDWGFYGQ